MAVNRQKIWQINFNKYNAVGGGLKCCHPLNYKNTTVNQSPPHVGEMGKSFTFIFSGITYSRKSGIYTGIVKVRHGIISTVPCRCCRKKWRCFCVGNPKLIPYETIVRATSGEPEATVSPVNDELLAYEVHRRLKFV